MQSYHPRLRVGVFGPKPLYVFSTTRRETQNPASRKRCTARSSAGEGRRAKKATVSGLGLGIVQPSTRALQV